MKFFTAAAALFTVFAVSAVARPNYDHYSDHHSDGRRGGGDDDITIHGCKGQGDITGVLPAVLQAGILSNNKKYCIQTVDDTDH
ncbi:hypothetical protein BDB00DRAFT_798191 [Zychaea mexicana]|uniref:uncharacterized protein n=1 Tax=Zychaea mexicana TaxID=64656 RepID=UPI0022FE8D06|nr:uncharacterized protein BDB00DRAFT_798191 [Zychaea mexicana]KAI9499071.1 hypothetical protein BDB00DRAFT_798191 [Zychaea mexicana]